MKKILSVLFSFAALLAISGSVMAEWRKLDPNNVIVMSLPGGQVLIELAPSFAPQHVANIRQMLKQDYFQGATIVRSQENYVVQWGVDRSDAPESEQEGVAPFGKAKAKLAMEFFAELENVNFTKVESKDSYANIVGYVDGFPVASDGTKSWLVHCNSMVGVGRGMEVDSGNGSSLYAVIGHSPRHLDRNVTLVGRVVKGMQWLSTLPRGTGDLGFYESQEQQTPITSLRMATAQDLDIEIMDTSSEAFVQRIKDRTTRNQEWFVEPTGKIEVCNVGVPSRSVK